MLGKFCEADGGGGFLLHGIPQQCQGGLHPSLPIGQFDALQADEELEQHGIEFSGLRVIDDLGCILVPMLRSEVYVGGEVGVALVQLGFDLN